MSSLAANRPKRVFASVTLSTNDIKTIHWYLAGIDAEVLLTANAARLYDPDDVISVIAEDQIVDRLHLAVDHPERGGIEFTLEQGYVLIEKRPTHRCVDDAFAAIVDLITALPKNGTQFCGIVQSPPGTWRAPGRVQVAGATLRHRLRQWWIGWTRRPRHA